MGKGSGRFTLLRYAHETLHAPTSQTNYDTPHALPITPADNPAVNLPAILSANHSSAAMPPAPHHPRPKAPPPHQPRPQAPAPHHSRPQAPARPRFRARVNASARAVSWATNTVVALWPGGEEGGEEGGEWDATRPHWLLLVERVKGAKAKGRPAPVTVSIRISPRPKGYRFEGGSYTHTMSNRKEAPMHNM